MHLRELKELYRAHRLTHKTQVYGVIGNPVGHSLSPLLHNTGYIAARKDAVFLPFLVERLEDFLKAVPDFGIRGFSVTLPHKEAVFRRLDECEPVAAKIGAVNTVTVRRDGSLHGSNTDYLGVLRALEKKMKLRWQSRADLRRGRIGKGRGIRAGQGGCARLCLCAPRECGSHVGARG